MIGYLAAALGGALGALGRWGVTEALPRDPAGWPWATLLVNLTGCLVLGLLLGLVFARSPDSPWLRPFLGTGVLGGFTTFSAVSVAAAQSEAAAALTIMLLSFATSIAAYLLGDTLRERRHG